MKPTRVHSRQDSLFPDDCFSEDSFSEDSARPDLDALETAKARQDLSHRKLDRFIAAALAELSDDYRSAWSLVGSD